MPRNLASFSGHFDAHVDTWPDDGKRLDHGSMFLRALNEGLIDPGTSVQIGIRSFSESDYGFNVLSAPWIHENGVRAAILEIRRVLGRRKAYLTFDIDCLDPAFAPGTGTPVAGGLSSAEALTIVRALGQLELVGMDIVEVALLRSRRDYCDRGGHLGARYALFACAEKTL